MWVYIGFLRTSSKTVAVWKTHRKTSWEWTARFTTKSDMSWRIVFENSNVTYVCLFGLPSPLLAFKVFLIEAWIFHVFLVPKRLLLRRFEVWLPDHLLLLRSRMSRWLKDWQRILQLASRLAFWSEFRKLLRQSFWSSWHVVGWIIVWKTHPMSWRCFVSSWRKVFGTKCLTSLVLCGSQFLRVGSVAFRSQLVSGSEISSNWLGQSLRNFSVAVGYLSRFCDLLSPFSASVFHLW